jgi:hypothetical protein
MPEFVKNASCLSGKRAKLFFTMVVSHFSCALSSEVPFGSVNFLFTAAFYSDELGIVNVIVPCLFFHISARFLGSSGGTEPLAAFRRCRHTRRKYPIYG